MCHFDLFKGERGEGGGGGGGGGGERKADKDVFYIQGQVLGRKWRNFQMSKSNNS